jgi:hypothetical protein
MRLVSSIQFAYLSVIVHTEEMKVVAVGGHPPHDPVLLLKVYATVVYDHLRGSANAFSYASGG